MAENERNAGTSSSGCGGTFAVAQLGARMHYAVPRILYSANALDRLYTDVYAELGLGRAITSLPTLHRVAAFRKLTDRHASGVPVRLVTAFGILGVIYWSRLRRAKTETDRLRSFLWASNQFARAVKRSGLGSAHAVYGFNSSSRGIFEFAKDRGMRTVLEQTIAPKQVEVEIMSRFSECADLGGTAETEEFSALERREWELADTILCASNFVRDGLVRCGVPDTKCQVIPYGVDLSRFRAGSVRTDSTRPVRVLFVGGIGERKGIPTLFAAMRQLTGTSIECRVVGPVVADRAKLARACPPNTRIVGTVPRSEIPREMQNADIFCLPTLCEGSATVTYEALAAGLPVVTTYNAGSIVRDGADGIIVPVGDADSLAEALLRLGMDSDQRRQMSKRAVQRSAHGSLDAYRSRLLEALRL